MVLTSMFPSLSVQLIAVSVIVLQRTLHHNQITTRLPVTEAYDFVVVGAGTAGSILAARLSENPAVRVLLLEAGGPQTVTTDAPSYAREEVRTEVDWGYQTTSQSPFAGNAFDGHVAIPRGRVVGGSHNLNYLVYSRGNRRDYDSWANDLGATGWNYSEVLPYFLRSENNIDLRLVSDNPGYHSTRGPVTVQTPSDPDPIITLFRQFIADKGYPIVDQNGISQLGINYFQQTIYKNATRSTTASAYLEANYGRPNLQVLTKAFVTKILFRNTSSGGLQAIGVEYHHENQTKRVFATREVLLCAGKQEFPPKIQTLNSDLSGSINTPQLLMLSGIGPRDHLSSFGIQTLVDLPVGFHLKDHVFVQFDFEIFNTSLITSGIDWTVTNMYRYFANSNGPLAIFPLVFMYLNSVYNNQTDWPDLQIDFNVAPVANDLNYLVSGYSSRTQDAWRNYYRDHVGQRNRLGVLAFHYRPRSEGRLYLNSSNPYDPPLLDTRYLTEQYDVDAMIDVARKALMMMHLSPFNQYVKLYRQPIPGCRLCERGPIWDCREYLECYVRAVTTTVGHQVGTCRMGSGNNSVVDPRLRVRGVERLRVVDGSIYPEITNGNTNAPVMMFAEYATDMIRADNGLADHL